MYCSTSFSLALVSFWIFAASFFGIAPSIDWIFDCLWWIIVEFSGLVSISECLGVHIGVTSLWSILAAEVFRSFMSFLCRSTVAGQCNRMCSIVSGVWQPALQFGDSNKNSYSGFVSVAPSLMTRSCIFCFVLRLSVIDLQKKFAVTFGVFLAGLRSLNVLVISVFSGSKNIWG